MTDIINNGKSFKQGVQVPYLQILALLKADVVIDVHNLAIGQIDHHIVKVTVTKADDVTNHRHDRNRTSVVQTRLPPIDAGDGGHPEFTGQQVTGGFAHQLHEDAAKNLKSNGEGR